jgi:ABC-2 type transport system ATP-binding protein
MFAIETNNVTKIYVKRQLFTTRKSCGVNELSLQINQGEIFGLLGLNGSGKTTTIKLLLGLLKPTKGAVSILGQSVPSTEVLKKIGYLPEVPYFYRYLTAEEILTFYARLSHLDAIDQRVERLLDTVGLLERRHKRLSEFSKGMLQRIGLAQSLLHDPEILIYDEPISGLDPMAIQEMRNLLLALKNQGKTIFLSSHLISEVEKICDRVAILSQGRLVRTLEQKDWRMRDGELEKIFVADVADGAEMGRLNFASLQRVEKKEDTAQ